MKFIYSESDQELLDKWDKYYDEYYKLLRARLKEAGAQDLNVVSELIRDDQFRNELFKQIVRVREMVMPIGIELIK